MNRELKVTRQAGLSGYGIVAILVVVASLVTLSLRLGPHYLDFYTIQSLIEEMPANKVHTMGKNEIRESLAKRFTINNIRNINVRDAIRIERLKGSTTLTVGYEAREHVVYNVDAILNFEKSYTFN